MHKSSQAERKSRATTNCMPARLSAALAPTQGKSGDWMKSEIWLASGWPASSGMANIRAERGVPDKVARLTVHLDLRAAIPIFVKAKADRHQERIVSMELAKAKAEF